MVFLVRETCVSGTRLQTWPRATCNQLKFVLTTSMDLHDCFVRSSYCFAELEIKHFSKLCFRTIKLIDMFDLHVLYFDSGCFAGAFLVSAHPPLRAAYFINLFAGNRCFFHSGFTLNVDGLMVPDGPPGKVTLLGCSCNLDLPAEGHENVGS